MPLGVQSDDRLVSDGLGAACTTRRELVSVAIRAVRTASLLHETATTELFPAPAAHEMVGVPRYTQGLDHTVSDGLPTAVAARAVVMREARHAVHGAVVLVELGAVDRLAARVALKVLGVPFLVQRRYDPSTDGSIATSANRGSFVARHGM